MDSNNYNAPDKGEQDSPNRDANQAAAGGPNNVDNPMIQLTGERLFGSKGQSTANSNQFSNMHGGGASASAKSQVTKSLLQTSVIKDLR